MAAKCVRIIFRACLAPQKSRLPDLQFARGQRAYKGASASSQQLGVELAVFKVRRLLGFVHLRVLRAPFELHFLGSNAALSNHAKSDHQFGVGGAKFESTEATRKQMAKRFVPFGQKNDSQKAESVNKRFKHEPPSPPSKVFSEQQLSQSVREILAPTTASSSTSSTQVQPPALSTTPLKRIKSETLMHHLNERMQHVYYDYEFVRFCGALSITRPNILRVSVQRSFQRFAYLLLEEFRRRSGFDAST